MSDEPVNILLIEDNPGDARLVEELLKDFPGKVNQLSWVNTLRKGLQVLEDNQIQIILLDLSLPDSRGLGTLKKLISQTPHIPVVVLTGTNDEMLAINAVQEGAQDYLVKGEFTARMLAMSVRYAIERYRIQEELRKKNAELAKALGEVEQRVQERTAQLSSKNAELEQVISQLTESEGRFRGTFEQAAVGMAHISIEGRFIRVNNRFCDITGYNSKELLAKNRKEINYDTDLNTGADPYQQLLSGQIQTFSHEKRYIQKNGGLIWVNLTISLLRNANGNPEYFITVIEDISQRKEAEERLAQTIDALVRSNAELEQFAFVASHDLQEPLRNVSSFVQLLAEENKGKFGPKADQQISIILEGATRMQTMIRDLLAFSRVTSRGQGFEDVNVGDILENVKSDLALHIQETKAEVTFDPMPTIFADPSQISQVFQNLLTNALKFYGDQPPRVHISARLANQEWIFSIQDNGIGIEKKYIDKLFVIFRRLNPRGKYPGTGIGLAVCKRIVERHGGRIWVESEVGKGSNFMFSIPLNKEDVTAHA